MLVKRSHLLKIRRNLKTKVSVGTGLAVLEPGRVIDDFPKVKIYFGSREGNWLRDLVVLDYSNPKVDRMITAEKALVAEDGCDVNLELYRMTVDPIDENHNSMARAERFVYTMKGVINGKKYNRKGKDFRFFEMLGRIRSQRKALAGMKTQTRVEKEGLRFERRYLSEMLVELNKRFVFAMAAVCFVLVGIPLGIRSHRKESTVGMAVSLAVSLGYYLVVILMLSLEKNYKLHPEMLIWLPVAACFALGAKLMRKHL